MLNAPVSTVIRDGEEQTVPSRELVLDDIAVFKAGDQITIRQYPGENVKVLVAGADEESPDDDKDVIEETEFEEE